MSDSFFVDTNVLIYVSDPSDVTKQERAREWMRRLWTDRSGRLSSQVLQEYYSVVTRKLKPGLERKVARAEVQALISWNPVLPTQALTERAWVVEDKYSLSWWDSLIVSAAQTAGCRYLLTEDLQDGMEFDDLTVLSPFSHKPY